MAILKSRYEILKLENQLCFPLYACSKEVIRRYKPFLDELDLTYTQYLVMLVLWEKKKMNVKDLGEKLYLDSGTLTPLLKKLESKGYIQRERSRKDERKLFVSIAPQGEELKEIAVHIPGKIAQSYGLEQEEIEQLYQLLYKIIEK